MHEQVPQDVADHKITGGCAGVQGHPYAQDSTYRLHDVHLFAPSGEVMILPVGGVDALRKVPGHPLALAAAPSSSSSDA